MPEKPSASAKQERFILAYLAANNIAIAARTAGINESTAHKWLKQEPVKEALKAAQKQLFEQELSALMRIVSKAIETLDRNMDGEEVLPSSQIRAAQIVLEQSIGIYKMSELEKEIDELKRVLGMKEDMGEV